MKRFMNLATWLLATSLTLGLSGCGETEEKKPPISEDAIDELGPPVMDMGGGEAGDGEAGDSDAPNDGDTTGDDSNDTSTTE
jgi:hypothetical protein